MAFGLLRLLIWRRRLSSPERLIDAVITDMRRKLTEARLQMLAADLARKRLADGSAESDQSYEAARLGIEKLEATLHELESRRNILIARTRDADARLAIERALMEADSEPAQVALDTLVERVNDSEAEARAVAEVRNVPTETRGGNGG